MQLLRSNRGGSQGVIAGIAVICIAVAAYFIFRQTKTKKEEAYGGVFYYCTNCTKEFVGSPYETPPIKCKFCNQVTAVVAAKRKCRSCGKTFIAYLQKYDPETKMLIERRKKGEKVPDEQIKNIMVSRFGEDDWLDAGTPEGIEVMSEITCPFPECGGTESDPLYPKEVTK